MLRKSGIKTPQLSIWPCSPRGASPATWKYLVDKFYNNETYSDLLYKMDGKKVVFLPYNPTCYDPGVEAEIQSNGGKNDITTVKMWALFGQPYYSGV